MERRRVRSSIESTDLILEILSRSSAKSIARFRRVSKFWASTLRRPYFTDLFFTRSSTRPRLLIALENSGDVILCSSPQLQSPEDPSSLLVAAEFHIRFPAEWCLKSCCAPVSGLIFSPVSPTSRWRLPVLCNPSTGQQVSVPKPRTTKEHVSVPKPRTTKKFCHSFFGYDPILKQSKVLFMSHGEASAAEEVQILTLGTGNWRLRKAKLTHYPVSEGICINGVLYYVARRVVGSNLVIACFGVNTERFKLIHPVNGVSIWPSVLVNFKGKLGGVSSEWRANDVGKRLSLELCLWVLEDGDAGKGEWSRRVYTLPGLWEDNDDEVKSSVSIAGVTAAGEIVLLKKRVSNPFYVYYYDLDRYTLTRVEIQGMDKLQGYRVRAFVDHVEDLKFLTGS